ncbi:unnamed protein product, partial [Rotaria magnacalcarata]
MITIILEKVLFFARFQESAEVDDDYSQTLPSNVQAISSFDDIQQSINSSNWIP